MDKLFKPCIHELQSTPCPPKFQRYVSVSLFLILGFDLFRPFERANQTKKTTLKLGCGGLLDYKGLNNSSIYGRTHGITLIQTSSTFEPSADTAHICPPFSPAWLVLAPQPILEVSPTKQKEMSQRAPAVTWTILDRSGWSGFRVTETALDRFSSSSDPMANL